MIKKITKKLIMTSIALLALLLLTLYAYILSKKNRSLQPRLVWGPVPIKNWAYAAQALHAKGFVSQTLMNDVYTAINSVNDFDLLTSNFAKKSLLKFLPQQLRQIMIPYFVFSYALRHFDIFHHPLSGGFIANTPVYFLEAFWLKLARKKIIILPYGSDLYQYSLVNNPSLRHGLLDCYPDLGKNEEAIAKRSRYWLKHADIVVTSMMIDGLSRWDVLPVNYVTINCTQWQTKKTYNNADGFNGLVTIVHTPNHRTIKGTEFIVAAVNALKQSGLQIELLLLENIQNNQVKKILARADILVDQLIINGYGLSAIEGMVTGLPVIANLDDKWYTQIFRRYSYLNECPILSACPETIEHRLRLLITQPQLRHTLGLAGRTYIEKYHSEQMAQYLFTAIYRKIWHNQSINLMDLFHPLKSSCAKTDPIKHPLVDNCVVEH